MFTPEGSARHEPEVPDKQEVKEWTVMFYLASDNPLASTIVSQLKAIRDAGYHPDANVIAQFDPYIVNTPSHVFDIRLIDKAKAPNGSGERFTLDDPYRWGLLGDKLWSEEDEAAIKKVKGGNVESFPSVTAAIINDIRNGNGNGNGNAVPDGGGEHDGWGEQDDMRPPMPSAEMSGEQEPCARLESFLDFCRENYPARHYMLIILGHGLAVSNDLFLFDEHASRNTLRLDELSVVLGKFNLDIAKGDVKGVFDLLGFHCCSMSGLEVAYELKSTARYVLASQGPAFVGSWPYRQILLDLFSHLNMSEKNVKVGALADRLKTETERPATGYLRKLFRLRTNELLDKYEPSQEPSAELAEALLEELNHLLVDPTFDVNYLRYGVKSSEETDHPASVSDCRRRNRELLAKAYDPEISREPDVDDIIRLMFYSCLHNSQDFQLAGYSFDICLCNLEKLEADATVPLKALSDALIKGLEDTRTKELILLAHWDAQSFWQETYTDIYDFCFCLARRCLGDDPSVGVDPSAERAPSSKTPPGSLKDIHKACEDVMHVLQRGRYISEDEEKENDGALDEEQKNEKALALEAERKIQNERAVVRAESAGPLYQYAHGLSVFFPWAEPIGSRLWNRDYARFQFSRKTSWMKFLKEYFKSTMRAPRDNELDWRESYEGSHLNEILLQRVRSTDFSGEGHLDANGRAVITLNCGPNGTLGKYGQHDPMGKYGQHDPAGKYGQHDPAGETDFAGIKNYPPFTRLLMERRSGDERRNGKPAKSP